MGSMCSEKHEIEILEFSNSIKGIPPTHQPHSDTQPLSIPTHAPTRGDD